MLICLLEMKGMPWHFKIHAVFAQPVQLPVFVLNLSLQGHLD